MKITIESTDQMVKVNGAPARIWEGKTELGVPVFCMITKIGVHNKEDTSQFETELKECIPAEITKGWHGAILEFLD